MRLTFAVAALSGSLAIGVGAALAQHHGHHGHHGQPQNEPSATTPDTRELVAFPPALAAHTLANMRDHLLALKEINDALARGDHDAAAKIAEERLGMSSLQSHGAHEVARYMPQGMQDAGTAMHRAASRFAIEVRNAGVTGDVKPALGALGEVMGACVGCHAGYRLK